MSQIKLLLTGAQQVQTEELYNTLSLKYSVYLADSSALTGERFVQIPNITDMAFAHKILKICLDNDFKIVVPQLFDEIGLLAPAKTLFGEYGIVIACPNKAEWDILADKEILFSSLSAARIAVPAFRKLEKFEGFAASMLQLGYPSKQVKVEPCTNNASSDYRIVDDRVDAYYSIFPDIENPLISYTQLSKIVAADNFPALFLSEHLEGQQGYFTAYFNDGELITDDEPSAILPEIAKEIGTVLNLNGCFELQFTQTEKGYFLHKLIHKLNTGDKLVTYITNELNKLD
ncbi:hypothetical protein NF867_02075 [Solitalea sp. MAHUQ-68]|uniref:ATP-grasp domain-containing protein n=1 Tax=Solitalea agri TaxID=2953739 RepID=A0A9X2JAP7_9SPHI|nr:hypothetical protein [Solitalea agri]MCO4291652.1 hypothetical protein [Solitalea agri]